MLSIEQVDKYKGHIEQMKESLKLLNKVLDELDPQDVSMSQAVEHARNTIVDNTASMIGVLQLHEEGELADARDVEWTFKLAEQAIGEVQAPLKDLAKVMAEKNK
jgi:hypothetical protein